MQSVLSVRITWYNEWQRNKILTVLRHPPMEHLQNEESRMSVSRVRYLSPWKLLKICQYEGMTLVKELKRCAWQTLELSAEAVWRRSWPMGQRMRSWYIAFPLWQADPRGSVSVSQDASASSQAVCLWHCSCNGWTCTHHPASRGNQLVHTSLIITGTALLVYCHQNTATSSGTNVTLMPLI
jgi:hypothetical protein